MIELVLPDNTIDVADGELVVEVDLASLVVIEGAAVDEDRLLPDTIGAEGQVLTVVAGEAAWDDPTEGGGTSGFAYRLGTYAEDEDDFDTNYRAFWGALMVLAGRPTGDKFLAYYAGTDLADDELSTAAEWTFDGADLVDPVELATAENVSLPVRVATMFETDSTAPPVAFNWSRVISAVNMGAGDQFCLVRDEVQTRMEASRDVGFVAWVWDCEREGGSIFTAGVGSALVAGATTVDAGGGYAGFDVTSSTAVGAVINSVDLAEDGFWEGTNSNALERTRELNGRYNDLPTGHPAWALKSATPIIVQAGFYYGNTLLFTGATLEDAPTPARRIITPDTTTATYPVVWGGNYGTVLAQGEWPEGSTLSDDDPEALGTADPGVATEGSRADHVHPMPSAADVGALGATAGAGGALSGSYPNPGLNEETVQDIVGAMVAGNTESGGTLTYDDTNGKIDLSVTGTVDVVSNVATARILGRTTSGSGDSEELTAAQTRSLLAVSWVTISDTTVSNGGSGVASVSVDVTGYTLLRVRVKGRSLYASASFDVLNLRFNSDSTSTYSTAGGALTTSIAASNTIAASQTNTNRQSSMIIDIGVGSSAYTNVFMRWSGVGSTATTSSGSTAAAMWNGSVSAALTSLQLFATSGNLADGTRIIVEGIA